MLCKAGADGMKIPHFDFNTAYLNASIIEELYMEQNPGFEDTNKHLV